MDLRDRLRRMIGNEIAILDLHDKAAVQRGLHDHHPIQVLTQSEVEAEKRILMYRSLLEKIEDGR